MTKKASSIAELPNSPAVYALIGGRGRGRHVAYVGIAGKLKNRVKQHLVRRDSSVVAGNAAARLDPENVAEVLWWEHPVFADRPSLEAAEMVAFEILDPALRSRGSPQGKAAEIAADPKFVSKMRQLFEAEATGLHKVLTLEDALEKIADLEDRIKTLEKIVKSSEHTHRN
jgi:hypothetical protein